MNFWWNGLSGLNWIKFLFVLIVLRMRGMFVGRFFIMVRKGCLRFLIILFIMIIIMIR